MCDKIDLMEEYKMCNKTDQVGMSSPWVTYARKLAMLLTADDTEVEYNSEKKKVTIRTNSFDKCAAFTKLLPQAVVFGNVILTIDIIPANDIDDVTMFKHIFANSPIVDKIVTIQPEGTSNPFTYILFKKEVVEYWDDNLGNPHGFMFDLYQNMAENVFEDNHDGIIFTTSSSLD